MGDKGVVPAEPAKPAAPPAVVDFRRGMLGKRPSWMPRPTSKTAGMLYARYERSRQVRRDA
jgi:hypothetical protein